MHSLDSVLRTLPAYVYGFAGALGLKLFLFLYRSRPWQCLEVCSEKNGRKLEVIKSLIGNVSYEEGGNKQYTNDPEDGNIIKELKEFSDEGGSKEYDKKASFFNRTIGLFKKGNNKDEEQDENEDENNVNNSFQDGKKEQDEDKCNKDSGFGNRIVDADDNNNLFNSSSFKKLNKHDDVKTFSSDGK